MPVRNGANFIGEAIASVQAQTDSDWRLLVFDHASTDATAQIVDAFAKDDHRVERIECSADLTFSQVLNLGFERSNAPFLMRHDADDLSLPNRVALQVAYMESHPELAVVGGQYTVIDAVGRVMGEMRLPMHPERVRVGMLFNNPIAHPAVMMRRSVLDAVGARYGNSFLAEQFGVAPISVPGLAEDYLLFGQLAILGLCANLPDILIQYRRHDATVGATSSNRQSEVSALIARHLMQILAAQHGEAWLDPLPFSNFAGQLVPIERPAVLPAQWQALRAMLERCFPGSAEAERELAFRDVLRTRKPLGVLLRFVWLMARDRPTGDEKAVVRSLLSKWLRD